MTLFVMRYTTPDSESASHEDSEYMVLVNGTEKFTNLDFREVCEEIHSGQRRRLNLSSRQKLICFQAEFF